MRIAIPTENNAVAAHFGRCGTYTIVDIEDGTVTSRQYFESPGHAPGRIPEFLHKLGADWILASGMGVRARDLLNNYGIKQALGVSGPVEDVINEFIKGTLEADGSPCEHHDHHDHQHTNCSEGEDE
ncbi:MAG: NifB/NifX family molybdenum-iron cluster-binding protein [Spirochaetales bacterium]|nr:NifB/NifX family molybdenum-iron cluster-binding protein [Spirochaetales bacterium]MCF7937162.1 NifB/NifX family molybdenum-iron cluster-binding protein [Spirochaetales bacterium]